MTRAEQNPALKAQLEKLAAALMVVILGGGLYWIHSHYSGVSMSADQGKLGRY